MPTANYRPIAVFYEHPDWLRPLFAELEDYSVSNRGLRAGLVGTAGQVAERIIALEEAGVGLLLLQFSPQLEEMERFAETVMPLVEEAASSFLSE